MHSIWLLFLVYLHRTAETKPQMGFAEFKPNKAIVLPPNSGNVLGQIMFTFDINNVNRPQAQSQLEYMPMRPFYYPNPGNNVAQIIAPGQPWPQSADEIANTSPSFNNVNQASPDLRDRLKETENLGNSAQEQPSISLEYKPMRPFHQSNPGFFVGQIVQPGQSWPNSPEEYQNFGQSISNIPNRVQETVEYPGDDITQKIQITISNVTQEKTPISLEYKPIRPSHQPNPGFFVGQIVLSGKPRPGSSEDIKPIEPTITSNITQNPVKPNSPEKYEKVSQTTPNLVNKLEETISSTMSPQKNQININLPNRMQETAKPMGNNVTQNIQTTTPNILQEKTPISLEYKPTRPPFHPNPGDNVGQIVPSGEPWPNSPESYKNFSQTTPDVINRLQETSTVNTLVNTQKTSQGKTPIILEYKPTRPSFHPNPGNNVGQIVPPGKPWPSSPEGYKNFSQITEIVNRVSSNTTQERPSISLEYKPMRPFYQPNPGFFVGQIVPPGKPWPSSPEGGQNFSQTTPDLVNRVQETANPTTEGKTPIGLEYKPTRPFHHPNPGNNVGQIVPSGKPQPSSSEGYENSSQTTPDLVNRVQETANPTTEGKTPISLEYKPTRPFYHPKPGNNVGQIVPSAEPWPGGPEGYKNSSQTTPDLVNRVQETSSSPMNPTTEGKTPISLEYKPTRPFHAPNPGNYVGQIVPPGKPWPASSEGYQNFSKPSLEDRFKESTTPSTTAAQEGFIWGSDDTNRVLYTSNPDLAESPTSTVISESTFESTTNETISTDGPLYTSAVLEVETTNQPSAKVKNRLHRMRFAPYMPMPFNLLPRF